MSAKSGGEPSVSPQSGASTSKDASAQMLPDVPQFPSVGSSSRPTNNLGGSYNSHELAELLEQREVRPNQQVADHPVLLPGAQISFLITSIIDAGCGACYILAATEEFPGLLGVSWDDVIGHSMFGLATHGNAWLCRLNAGLDAGVVSTGASASTEDPFQVESNPIEGVFFFQGTVPGSENDAALLRQAVQLPDTKKSKKKKFEQASAIHEEVDDLVTTTASKVNGSNSTSRDKTTTSAFESSSSDAKVLMEKSSQPKMSAVPDKQSTGSSGITGSQAAGPSPDGSVLGLEENAVRSMENLNAFLRQEMGMVPMVWVRKAVTIATMDVLVWAMCPIPAEAIGKGNFSEMYWHQIVPQLRTRLETNSGWLAPRTPDSFSAAGGSPDHGRLPARDPPNGNSPSQQGSRHHGVGLSPSHLRSGLKHDDGTLSLEIRRWVTIQLFLFFHKDFIQCCGSFFPRGMIRQHKLTALLDHKVVDEDTVKQLQTLARLCSDGSAESDASERNRFLCNDVHTIERCFRMCFMDLAEFREGVLVTLAQKINRVKWIDLHPPPPTVDINLVAMPPTGAADRSPTGCILGSESADEPLQMYIGASLYVRSFASSHADNPRQMIIDLRKNAGIEHEPFMCFHLRNAKFPPILGMNYMNVVWGFGVVATDVFIVFRKAQLDQFCLLMSYVALHLGDNHTMNNRPARIAIMCMSAFAEKFKHHSNIMYELADRSNRRSALYPRECRAPTVFDGHNSAELFAPKTQEGPKPGQKRHPRRAKHSSSPSARIAGGSSRGKSQDKTKGGASAKGTHGFRLSDASTMMQTSASATGSYQPWNSSPGSQQPFPNGTTSQSSQQPPVFYEQGSAAASNYHPQLGLYHVGPPLPPANPPLPNESGPPSGYDYYYDTNYGFQKQIIIINFRKFSFNN